MSTRQHSRKTARQNSTDHDRKSKSQYHRTLRYELLEDRRLLAVVTVTTLADMVDFNDGKISLREAIFATNTVPGADTIDFAPSLTAGGPATILLTQGELRVSDSLTINGPGASLLTVDATGNDATPAIKDGKGSRVFNINDGRSLTQSEVTIVGLSLTGGDVTGIGGAISSSEILSLIDSTVSGNSARTGGGIYSGDFSNGKKLTIIRSVIQNNSAVANGGGVFASGSDGLVEMSDSVVSNNTAGVVGSGGGVFVAGGTMNINRTSIRGNSANRGGGGIQATGNLSINDSSITGNSSEVSSATVAVYGGGGVTAKGNLTIVATTISGNSSKSVGGGLFCSGTATIADCIITGNSAMDSGGGVVLGTGKITVTNGAIRGNSAGGGGGGISSNGSLVVANSEITGNFANGVAQNSSYRDGGGIRCIGSLLLFGTTISGNSSKYDGGGIWSGLNTNVAITNSTISGNSAGTGGGVWVTSGASIAHSTIVSNSAQVLGGGFFVQSATLEVQLSIVAQNSAPVGRNLTGLIGTMIVPRYSLIGWNAESGLAEAPVGAPDADGNLIGGPMHGAISPMLGPLADNGGIALPDESHVFMHALLPGSPAISAGDPAAVAGAGGVPLNDQRGAPFTRVYGGRIDIGAFEFQPAGGLAGDFNR
ncbi:MAG TPA: CSLREA domain-containing protein, partial [Pirellulaceae bacterium]